MASTDRQTRGETSELEVAMHLIDKYNCRVSQTFGHEHPYDLLGDYEGHLLKIQVKTATPGSGNQQEFTIKNPDRYSTENVDLFAGQPRAELEPFFYPTEEVDLEASNPRAHVTYTSREEMGPEVNWEDAYHISEYTFEEAFRRWLEDDYFE